MIRTCGGITTTRAHPRTQERKTGAYPLCYLARLARRVPDMPLRKTDGFYHKHCAICSHLVCLALPREGCGPHGKRGQDLPKAPGEHAAVGKLSA
jgi:hypothetical protein